MMMSLLWYYRPEHTETGRTPKQMPNELFASKHRDVNPVATIDDKCFVLTFNEFCRFKKQQKLKGEKIAKSLIDLIVPKLIDGYPRRGRLPPVRCDESHIFCCRKVYDIRTKKILKNPA